ncbi:MAG: RNA 2',3'-cyclic phosphodiesterase [Candidatus Nitrosotenuis sp.]
MRTFVAVEISSKEVLDSIKKIQSSLDIAAKPVDTQNIHFTLLFLGEISEDVAQKVLAQLKTIEFFPFDVSFEGMGAFPKPKFPRVIWVGVDDGGGKQLVNLAKKVEEKMLPLGFKSDKAFMPHVTIFRIKNKVSDITHELSKYSGAKFGVQRVSEIKFKQSVLTPTGPIYSDIGVIGAK